MNLGFKVAKASFTVHRLKSQNTEKVDEAHFCLTDEGKFLLFFRYMNS